MKLMKVTHFSQRALWLGLLLAALVTRFVFLDNKPIHFDEAINGWFVGRIRQIGYYDYDPNNYHGPLYFYLLLWVESWWGQSLQVLRSVPAVFSFLSVLLFSLPAVRSRWMLNALAVLVLISPAFVFFGRSGIHEMPFVFFQLVMALGLLRWMEKPDGKAWSLFLAGLWGMVCLKETFVITLFAWVVAFVSLGWERLKILFSWQTLKEAWTRKVSLLFVGLLSLWAGLFTGFFKDLNGLGEFFRAVLPWLKTGVHGQGHEKAAIYWLKTFLEAEPLALLGVVVAVFGIFSRRPGLRVLSVFSLTQLLVYSLIPYKTVWCILSIVWGFYFVLALKAQEILQESVRWKSLVFAVLVVSMGAMNLSSAFDSTYRRPMDLNHPYVYVNSTYELTWLSKKIVRALSELPPEKQGPYVVQIGMKEQWPWPWLLRDQKGVFYELCAKRYLSDASVYFCDPADAEVFETLLNAEYWKISIVLRQSKEASVVYLKKTDFDMSDYTGLLQIVGPREEEAAP